MRVVAAIACLFAGCANNTQQGPIPLEVDHLFVFVPAPGSAEASALTAAGFRVDTAIMRHEGQGTASRSAVFENFYLELIWIDATVPVTPENQALAAEMQPAASWRTTGASPFGIGFRISSPEISYPVPARRYSAPWMEAGSFIELLRQPDEPHATEVFTVPSYMALPGWISWVRENTPTLLRHQSGVERLTSLELRGPPSHTPRLLKLRNVQGLRLSAATEPVAVLEFDGGRRGVTVDLRPLLPLLVRK